ncbi:MAG: hypothetical protein Q8R47_03620 [Nanoarchaeota archaeon]|nr:hypothetical protein [Nanoarchaeota archaeon]
MSLEKKVMLGLLTALSGAGCTHKNNSAYLGGTAISEASTDNKGKAYFSQEGIDEKVEVEVTIAGTDFPVADAYVLYFDNSDFKSFLISHPAFQPQLNIALHNSEHLYSLTPAPLPFLYNKPAPEKEQSKPAAEHYLSWAKAHWEHTSCLNKKNMVTLMKPGAFLLKRSGIIETIGFSENKFDEGVQYIEDNLPASAVADVYVFIPYQHGFSASTTTITALDIRFDGKCAEKPSAQPGSGKEGKSDNDCSGMLFCDEFRGTALNTSKWNIINDSGIEVYGGWLSLPNASSIAAQHGFGNSCADKRVDIRTSAYGSSIFLGKMGLSAGKNTGILSCGKQSKAVNIAGAENGLSLYKSGGLLSLLVGGQVTSVPCSENISYVQLTAGLNDVVEIDYVRVRCN